jgi:hypothetical protein
MKAKRSVKTKSRGKSSALPKGWHPKAQKPTKVGVYRTSRLGIVHIGGAYGHWNGKKWERFQQFGDYSPAPNMIWAREGTPFASKPAQRR